MTESFESWAYRKGLRRRLAELERRQLVESAPESKGIASRGRRRCERVVRLTESGRIHALGGRDPEARWARPWDGRWRIVVYDLPASDGTRRNRLRNVLRSRGFGWLQRSVWVSPDPLSDGKVAISGDRVDVQSLILLHATLAAGESDADIVSGAWDFDEINRGYARYLNVLADCPSTMKPVSDEATMASLRQWSGVERQSWVNAIQVDPLLPGILLPSGYLGRRAWQKRIETFADVQEQLRWFKK